MNVMLHRVGDFYEAYGQDAIEVSAHCGFALTTQRRKDGDRIATGFPFHKIDSVIQTLNNVGDMVAVVENDSTKLFTNTNDKTRDGGQSHKTMLNSFKSIYTGSYVFAIIDGKLLECKVKKNIYKTNECLLYLVLVLPDGSSKTVAYDENVIFKDKEMSAPAKLNDFGVKDINVKDVDGIYTRIKLVESDDVPPFTYHVWSSDGLSPVCGEFTVEEFILEDNNPISFKWNKELPARIYENKEDVFKWTSHEAVLKDGTTTIVEGGCSKLLLNDKQKKAVNNLMKAFAQLEAAGVSILYYGCEEEMNFVPSGVEVCDEYNKEEGVEYDEFSFNRLECRTLPYSFYVSECEKYFVRK